MGRVLSDRQQPIRSATVTSARGGRSSVTDSLGRFVLRGLGAGVDVIGARAIGFAPRDSALTLTADETRVIVFVLRASAVPLEAVEVRSKFAKPARYAGTGRFDDFYQRRARGVGTFFTREDIEQSGLDQIFELLRTIPGVRVDRRNLERPVTLARCSASGESNQRVALFVDGMRIGEPGTFLMQLKAADVEAFEVYRGPAQLPQEAMGDACGAIYIHMRYSVGSVLSTMKPQTKP